MFLEKCGTDYLGIHFHILEGWNLQPHPSEKPQNSQEYFSFGNFSLCEYLYSNDIFVTAST